VTSTDPPLTRAQRRQVSEERILDAARGLFVDVGYDRTTIRAVAAKAGVDPALVLQHFRSKEELFRQVVASPAAEHVHGGPERIVELLLERYGVKLEMLPTTSLALLRSMLTHPEAAAHVRNGLTLQLEQIAGTIDHADARLRAGLIVTSLLGAILGRHLLELDALRDASPERIIDLLRAAFQTLTQEPSA
jgi:AcrR family transcriptional regulator